MQNTFIFVCYRFSYRLILHKKKKTKNKNSAPRFVSLVTIPSLQLDCKKIDQKLKK